MSDRAAEWMGAIERGDVSQHDAAILHQQGIAPPEQFSYLDASFRANCDLAVLGEVCPLGAHGLDDSLALNLAGYRRANAAGIDHSLLVDMMGAGDIWAARIDVHQRGERFQLGGPDGRLVVAVRDEYFERVDAVAIALHNEDEWSMLTGQASFLGKWNLVAAERSDSRAPVLRLHSTPLRWMQAGGEGVCVLDWCPEALMRLRGLGERVVLRCDAGASRKLRGMLAFGGVPRVKEVTAVREVA